MDVITPAEKEGGNECVAPITENRREKKGTKISGNCE
jgi:hypothetical protein